MVSRTFVTASDLIMAEGDKSIENGLGLAAVDRFCPKRHAVPERVGLAGDEQGRRGIEEHDIAKRPTIALQQSADMSGVLGRVAAYQVFGPRVGQPGIAGRDPEGRHLTAVEHGDMADACRGELVEPVASMHHPGPLDAEQAEHFCQRLYPLLGVYAYHLEFGA